MIVVFGCGGDRDKSKRSKMLKVAINHASKIIFTSDNSRSETFEDIFKDASSGNNLNNVKVVEDRKENDKDGLDMNKGGDAIKIAGNMARVRGYKTMKWDTHRNPRAWKLACKEEGKVRVISSEVEIELFEKRLDIDN